MSQLSKLYLWMLQRCVQGTKEKGWSMLGMFGVLIIVALLGFGGNYLYLQLKNAEKAETLHNDLRNSFAVLSDIIVKQTMLENITMAGVVGSGVFPEALIKKDNTVEDYFGNRIDVAYRQKQGENSTPYVAYQTLISSSNRAQICGVYLKLLENQPKKDYLRLVDTVTIIDRGNPNNNITFCADNSTEECRRDVWASLSDLNGENRNEICNFYCKEYPCLLSIYLTQN